MLCSLKNPLWAATYPYIPKLFKFSSQVKLWGNQYKQIALKWSILYSLFKYYSYKTEK